MVDTDQYYIKQFGFREKHSMVLAISELMGEIMKGFNNNFFKLAIFTDLRKAFDTVDHNILLGKLQFYGVDGIALTWFESYLNRRQQAVEIQNTKSQMELIDCSVPQGGVLAPQLFLFIVNDMIRCLKYSSNILFADDTTIYVIGQNIKFLQHKIQFNMNNLYVWLCVNRLSLNTKKCKMMLFKPSHSFVNTSRLVVAINNESIELVDQFKF